MDKELVVSALLMALWKRKPKQIVMIHSDQGSQFSSYEWQAFLKEHNLKQSMSRRGNCHDNAVVESFFQLLKRERIKRKTYASRAKAREDIFDYIEMFYDQRKSPWDNPVRRHGYNNGLSPVVYEKQYQALRLGAISDENARNLENSAWTGYTTPTAATPTLMLVRPRQRFVLLDQPPVSAWGGSMGLGGSPATAAVKLLSEFGDAMGRIVPYSSLCRQAGDSFNPGTVRPLKSCNDYPTHPQHHRHHPSQCVL
jgi:hypothetical protein